MSAITKVESALHCAQMVGMGKDVVHKLITIRSLHV